MKKIKNLIVLIKLYQLFKKVDSFFVFRYTFVYQSFQKGKDYEQVYIYYGCTIAENALIGFRDEVFYKNLSISTKKMKDRLIQIDHDECLKLFEKYTKIKDKILY